MRKKIFRFSLLFCVLLSGCARSTGPTIEDSANVEASEASEVGSEPAMVFQNTAEKDDVTEDSTSMDESSSEAVSDNKLGLEAGLYDRTYLKDDNGVYTYRLEDSGIIEKYDNLYTEAFEDVVRSYNEVMEWQQQSYHPDHQITADNLLYTDSLSNEIKMTGSYFEMDYNFKLSNIGYTYIDLDSDGTFELIFGVLDDADADWIPKDCFERAYALIDGQTVKFCEGGSRELHWLGSDGYTYETASGGAAYWGISKLRFNSSELVVGENADWGSNGYTEEEFIGYLGSPVHILGSSSGIDDASQVPECQISEAECSAQMDEWESRQVDIVWHKMSDYIAKHSVVCCKI